MKTLNKNSIYKSKIIFMTPFGLLPIGLKLTGSEWSKILVWGMTPDKLDYCFKLQENEKSEWDELMKSLEKIAKEDAELERQFKNMNLMDIIRELFTVDKKTGNTYIDIKNQSK